jgi:uncharacterized membrane protein YbhN (UPF0104 family)
MARTLKVKLGWWESLSLTILGRAGNSFTPFRVGSVYRAIYMKTVHEMAFSRFVGIFFGFSVVVFGTSAIVATVSAIIVSAICNAINWAIVFSLVIVLVVSFFFVWLPGKFQRLEDMRNSRLAVFLGAWYSIRSSRATFSACIIGNFVSILTFIAAYKVVFAEIGSYLGWVECAMLASIGKIINLIQLVPGSLGIYEGSLAFLAHTFDLSPSAGLSVAILLRVCHLLILIALIGPSWIYLRNQMNREHKKF